MSDLVERLLALSRAEHDDLSIGDEAADEIERLRGRLEMTHAYRMVDDKMTRVPVEPGSIPDGIECRDETIRLQDETIARLRALTEWRFDMENAPRDGARILLAWGGKTVVGFYLDNSAKPMPWQGWRVPAMETWPEGVPTAWLPLPPPPVKK